jgi:hypothetical protein
MYQDYKDLLCAFHAHGVKYLIVGGYGSRGRWVRSISQEDHPSRRQHANEERRYNTLRHKWHGP